MKIEFQCQAIGLYLGFPECCIEAFRTREGDCGDDFPLHGTGYVPCDSCCEKSEEELIATIEENRLCEHPFPEEGSYSDLYARARAAMIKNGIWSPAD